MCNFVKVGALRDIQRGVCRSKQVLWLLVTPGLLRAQALLPQRPAQLHCRSPSELVLLGGMTPRGADSPAACYRCAPDARAQGPDDPKAPADFADADSLGSVVPEEDTVVLPAPLEHVLLEETLPLDAKALWRLVMADAAFWAAFLEKRQARGVRVDGWAHVKAGPKRARPGCPCAAVACWGAHAQAAQHRLRCGGAAVACEHPTAFQPGREEQHGCWAGAGLERRLEYTVPVKRNRLGPREARCEEVQRCKRRGAAGFHVQVIARTPEVRLGGPNA